MSISRITPAASLLSIVESYRDRIRRETGRTPDYPSALKSLDELASDGDAIEAEAFPVRRDLLPLRLFLAERDYTDVAIESILRDVSRTGSVWCSASIDENDRDAAEATIPGVNAWQWGPEADEATWTATGDCADSECRCSTCRSDHAAIAAAWEHDRRLVDPSEEGRR
jgi:hypothetical protein